MAFRSILSNLIRRIAPFWGLLLIVSTAYASSKECTELFVTLEKLPAIRAQNSAVQQDENKTLIMRALIRQFEQGSDTESVRGMKQLGLDQKEMTRIVRPRIEKDLERARAGQKQFLLSEVSPNSVRNKSSILNPGKSISDFVTVHNLEKEQIAASNILEQSGLHTVDALKMAILSNQKDLAREALHEVLRYGNLDDAAKLAVELGENEMLMKIGRLAIAQYIFHNRNSNYIGAGLNALIEVTGQFKEQAEKLLIDFSDLIASGAIFERMDMHFAEEYEDYDYLALRALLSASTLVGRFDRDSVSYHYVVATSNSEIKKRLVSLIETLIQKRNFSDPEEMLTAAKVLDDPKYYKSIAQRLFDSRYDVSDETEVERHSRKINFNTSLSLKFALLSGDVAFIANHLKKVFENPSDLLSVYFPESWAVLIPEPAFLTSIHFLQGLPQDEKIVNIVTEFQEGLRRRRENKTTLKREGHFLPKLRFWHEKSFIKSSLERNHGSNENEWWQFHAAIYARDVKKLREIYDKWMVNGRGVDAKYAAFAIFVIESGGNVDAIDALVKNQKLLPE